ncbi:MAG: JAB domain-containing protein [Polyangiaceae bacterium]
MTKAVPEITSEQTSPPPQPRDLKELEDDALLAVLLGKSRNPSDLEHARALLGMGGGLVGLSRLGPGWLARQAGLGPSSAARLAAAFELGKRQYRRIDSGRRIDSLDAVLEWATPKLVALEHEEMWLLCLDARNSLRCSRKIGQGGLHSLALTTRDILRPALREGANAILLVHNHPSGDPAPSPEDIQMTRAVLGACKVVGLPLLDHVIVGREGAASLLALGAISSR